MHVVKVVTSRTIYGSLVTERTDWVLDGGKFYLKVEGISMEGKRFCIRTAKKCRDLIGRQGKMWKSNLQNLLNE